MRTFFCAFCFLCVTRHAWAQPAEGDGEDEPQKSEPSKPEDDGNTGGEGSGDKPPEPEEKATITVTGIVEAPELDAPLAGATVTVIGTKNIAVTDDEGRY